MHVFSFLKRLQVGLLIAGLVLLFSVGLAAKEKKEPAQPAQAIAGQAGGAYVGSQTCQGCHDKAYSQFERSPHRATLTDTKATPGGHGCEACHGAGQGHVDGGGDKSKIISFKNLKADQVAARCLQCHANNQDHQAFQSSQHLRTGVTCTSCHSVHAPKVTKALLTQKDPGLCYSCHATEKAAFMKPFHHRVDEGLVKCTDCHSAHGGATDHQLRATAVQDAVCFKCHSEKRGPFLFEHAPVKIEGCSACHTPHGSSNPRLLTRAQVNSLCLTCHSALATGMTSGNHQQNTARQSCIACHSQIHGSNANNRFFK